jgi:hypothetical protein
LVDYDLMHEMKWSWDELQATPLYVRRYCWDIMQVARRVEQDRLDQAEREARHA